MLNGALFIIKPTALLINFSSLPPKPQIVNKMNGGVILPAHYAILISEGAKKFRRKIYHDKPSFSTKDIYRRTHEIAVFYEWIDTHDKIITQ